MKRFVFAVFAAFLVFAGAAHAQDFRVPGSYVGVSGGVAVQGEATYDQQYVTGVVAGVDLGTGRLEVGYDRLFMTSPAFAAGGQIDGDLLAVRGFVEKSYGRVTPFVGAGVGYVWLDGGAVGANSNDVAYILTTGANFDLTQKWTVGGAYEYITADAKVGNGAGGFDDWDAHVLKGTVRYNF